jgi:HEAT repeat protein
MRLRSLFAASMAAVLACAMPAFSDDLAKDGLSHGKTLAQWTKDLTDPNRAKDPAVVEIALQNISNYGKNAEEAIGPVVWHLEYGTDVGVRANAAFTLGAIGLDANHRKRGITTLSRRARYDLPNIRYQAIVALGKFGQDARDAIANLKVALTDRDTWEIRRVAAYALGCAALDKNNPADASVIEALTRRGYGINDSCTAVRIESFHALIKLGAPNNAAAQAAAIKTLEDILKDKATAKNLPVVIWTHVALMRMDKEGDDHVKAVTDQLKSPDAEVRVEAATALDLLAAVGITRVPELIEALAAPEQPAEVADALGKALIASKDKVNPRQLQNIVALLKDRDPLVRCHGCLGLAALQDQAKAYTPELVVLLKDPDVSVVKSAIAALVLVAEPPSTGIAPLRQLVNESKDASVQVMAIMGAEQLSHRGNKVAQQEQPKKPTP